MTPPAATATPAARTPAGHAREKILATAFRLFYAQGLRAAGIDTIIAESGVAKATFYKYFPAKDDLILAYLEKVDGIWTGQLHAAAEAAGPDPAASSWDCSMPSAQPAGATATAAAPSSTPPPSPPPAPACTLGPWHTNSRSWPGSAGLADQAGARDPDQLARSLTLLLDGGLASGVLDADPAAAAAARDTAAQLVAAGLGNSPYPQLTRSTCRLEAS